MLEDFVKWMASLPESERAIKMDILINLFAPSQSHEDFKRLKAAYKRKEAIIEKLKKNNKAEKPKLTYDNLYNDILKLPCYKELQRHIVAVKLYKSILNQNKILCSGNKKLRADIETLIYKLHHPEHN